MKSSLKRILPILLVIVTICSIAWYLFVYDKDFTKDMLLQQARYFEDRGDHGFAAWLYEVAYYQSGNNDEVAIELAEQFKANNNYSKAEYTLSNAIAAGGSVDLYIALCRTYVEQDKLLDAVTMLDHVSNPEIKEQLDDLRPSVPVATPAPGFYSQYVTVTIESDKGMLYAANDGEYPSIHSDTYQTGMTLNAGENRIYAVSVSDEGLVSPLAVLGYTVGGVIEEVTLSDHAIDVYVRQTLGLSADARLLTSDLWNITSMVLPQSVTNLSDLQYFPYLTSLTIKGNDISNLQILSALTQLKQLSVTNIPVDAQELATIAALPNLTELTLSNCMLSGISNLAAAHNLQYLDLSNNTIRNASALSFMSSLQTLNLSRNALTNLSYLSSLTNLKVLDVSYNSLASVVPLAGCTGLTELNISNNSISKLTGIESLTELTKLNAQNNTLTEADLLTANTKLVELTLANNTLLDISSLSALTDLQYLNVSTNELESLPQWSKDCALVHIDASNNKLTDVSPLAGFEKLNTVIIDNNSIEDIDILASCHHLIRVNATGNPIKDVSKLKEQSIIVNYTPIV